MSTFVDTENIDKYQLPNWYAKDHLTETEDKKYSIFSYNVVEYSMNAYACNLGIYDDNLFDKPFLNSGDVYINFNHDKFYGYLPKLNCLIFIMIAYKESSKKSGYPFLIIKPNIKKFAIIEWDYTSLYYGFEEIDYDTIVLQEKSSNELNSRKINKRTGEQFKLSFLDWFDFDQFANAEDIYLNQ